MAQLGYPGIGRLAYVLWSFLLYPLLGLVVMGAMWLTALGGQALNERSAGWLWGLCALVVFIGFLIAAIAVEVQRLRNLGMSGWWILGKLVPLLNLWVLWRMFACPEGYADHKELDLPGKIITGFIVVVIALPVAFGLIQLMFTVSSP